MYKLLSIPINETAPPVIQQLIKSINEGSITVPSSILIEGYFDVTHTLTIQQKCEDGETDWVVSVKSTEGEHNTSTFDFNLSTLVLTSINDHNVRTNTHYSLDKKESLIFQSFFQIISTFNTPS